MDKRLLIVIGVLAALVLICLVGAVVIGGVVFAATRFENCFGGIRWPSGPGRGGSR